MFLFTCHRSQDEPWFNWSTLGQVGPAVVRQAVGVLCWKCGVVKESIAKPDESDESYIQIYQRDDDRRNLALSATQALEASGRKPEDAKTRSRVFYADGMGKRHYWTMAFVETPHFTAHFKMPPVALGYKETTKPNLDLEEIPGVYMRWQSDWPPDLPFSFTDIYIDEGAKHEDYIHFHEDLHEAHGKTVFTNVTTNLKKQRQSTLPSASWVKAITLRDIEQKVAEIASRRAQRAAELTSGVEAGPVAPQPAVVSSASRMLRGTPAPSASLDPSHRGAGRPKSGPPQSTEARPSGPSVHSPALTASPSAMPPPHFTPERLSRVAAVRSPPVPQGQDKPSVPSGLSMAGRSTRRSGISSAASMASAGGASVASHQVGSLARALSFDPPTNSGASAFSVSAGPGVGGPSTSRAAISAARMAKAEASPKLGGIRGSPEVGVEEVFSGYNAGREVKAVTNLV